MIRCPNCGEENPERFRLCGYCATPLVAAPPQIEVRKTVTVVFCDLKGSTSLGERLDSEALREVLDRYFGRMRAALERHGGTVEKYIGDAVMAVFGLPRLHEDDALRAVRATIDMQRALTTLNQELMADYGVQLANRIGVNTGEVVAGDARTGQRLVTGDVVNVAARLEQAATSLGILIGEATYRLVRDAVDVEPVEPLELKGKTERVPAYRLLAVRAGEAVTRYLGRPIVGREPELAALEGALDRAKRDLACQLVAVSGPAGVGKSRLLEEFLRRAGDSATTLQGRCLSYGEGITFWPLAEIVRGAAGIVDEDDQETALGKLLAVLAGDDGQVADRVATAIGLSDRAYRVEELFWGARRFFEILARDRPLIVLVNDIHWAEATFLELLDHVRETATEAAIVLVCSSRPEILDDHPDWGRDRERSTTIALQPLTAADSGRVVDGLLEGGDLDSDVRRRIVEAAHGNPLFVEQLLSMLIDDGSLQRDGERWVYLGDQDAPEVPRSISALLAARLDRLETDERHVLERAAIVGQVFYPSALVALSEGESRRPLDQMLAALVRRQLIGSTTSTFADESAYEFLHILIRDAAYQGILKRRRADLHARFADWVETEAGIRIGEQSEIIGYHLEQAVGYLGELGPLNDRGRATALRGAEHLAAAGHRAFGRGDMPAAGKLLRRAASLRPSGDEERRRLLLGSGEALTEAGEFGPAHDVLAAAIDESRAAGDTVFASTAAVVELHRSYATEGADEASVLAELDRSLAIVEAAEDDAGLARAYRLLTLVHWTALRNGPAEAAALRSIEHARRAGDTIMEVRFLPSLVMSARSGPTPASQAIELAESLLPRVGDDSKGLALILSVLANLKAMRGDVDEARDLYQRSRALLIEHGWKLYAALTSLDSGPVEFLAGDPHRAEAELRADFETLNRMGERNYIATTAAMLAEALVMQARDDEADAMTAFSESVAAGDDLSAQFRWRLVRARVRARQGRFDEAEALAREGLALVRRSDEIDNQGNALMDLAAVLQSAGQYDAATAAVREALDLFEAKGNVVSADRARVLLSALSGSVATPS